MKRLEKISGVRLTFFVSVFIATVHNAPTVVNIFNIIEHNDVRDIGFIFSIPVFFAASINVLFMPFSFKFFIKPVFIFFILCGSVVSYAVYAYRVVFNIDMVRNIFETNNAEALSYINTSSVLWFLLTGIFPSALIVFVTIKGREKVCKEVLYRFISVLLSIFAILIVALFYGKEYSSTVRNNPSVRSDVVPLSFIYNVFIYIHDEYFKVADPFALIGEDARLVVKDGEKPLLLFFVVGETARGKNFSMNGYRRETNPFTSKIDRLISYQDVRSCGTTTAVSVPCMFSELGRKDFDVGKARHKEGLLDVMKRAGVSVLWKENNSSCKGVCDRVPNRTMKSGDHPDLCSGKVCYDEVLLRGLEDEVADMTGSKLVVFHLIGSHGPEYYRRYPEAFRRFTPECSRGDIENCSDEELENTYDNSLVYTDGVISKMIYILKQYNGEYNTALLYVSDHGESLGENGFYLHGLPYVLAPEEQTRIPMQLWMSGGLVKDKGIDWACLQENAMRQRYSHDNLFHSLLGLLDIQTEVYDSAQDIFHPCRSDGLRGAH